MVNKPRSRKRPSNRRAYLSVATVAIILIGGMGYLYVSGDLPFLKSGSTTTACSPVTKPVTYITLTSSNPIYAMVNTSKGNFEIELFPRWAPQTVTNFVSLAKSGFYDNVVWHRIEPGPPPFVIQTGDPTTRCGLGDRLSWGTGGSNITVPLEINKSLSLHNYAGYLGMARGQDNNSGTSQFYISLGNNTNTAYLDGRYTVFGKVITNMNVVYAIGNVPVEYMAASGIHEPVTPVYVYSITIINQS